MKPAFFPRAVVEAGGNRWDWLLLPLVLSLLTLLAFGAQQMSRPYHLGEPLPLSLDAVSTFTGDIKPGEMDATKQMLSSRAFPIDNLKLGLRLRFSKVRHHTHEVRGSSPCAPIP